MIYYLNEDLEFWQPPELFTEGIAHLHFVNTLLPWDTNWLRFLAQWARVGATAAGSCPFPLTQESRDELEASQNTLEGCLPLRQCTLYDLPEGDAIRIWSLETLLEQLTRLKEEDRVADPAAGPGSETSMASLMFFQSRIESFTHTVHALHDAEMGTRSCTDDVYLAKPHNPQQCSTCRRLGADQPWFDGSDGSGESEDYE